MRTEYAFIAIIIIVILFFSAWYFFKPLECELSLCDCECYPKGQTPEELTGGLCGINCLGLYNISGCILEGGQCKVVKKTGIEKPSLINPASAFCEEQGYTIEIREDLGGQYGVCIFQDSECDEWQYYRGECKPGDIKTAPPPSHTYCEKNDDCVPAQCCHPTFCVNKAVNCTEVACTEECRVGTMDCGCGSCVCRDNRCGISWINETWC